MPLAVCFGDMLVQQPGQTVAEIAAFGQQASVTFKVIAKRPLSSSGDGCQSKSGTSEKDVVGKQAPKRVIINLLFITEYRYLSAELPNFAFANARIGSFLYTGVQA